MSAFELRAVDYLLKPVAPERLLATLERLRRRPAASPSPPPSARLERRLPNPPFLRIHRSFLVNLRHVVEMWPYFNGAYLIKIEDAQATELTVSRGHVKDLRSLLGL